MAHYVIVEWKDSGVSVINNLWMTPMKKQAFWPPCKEQKVFNKIIKESDPLIDDSWSLHEVKRCMYETDDFDKAVKKCVEAEDTSNLESDDVDYTRKRKLRAKKYISSSEGSGDENEPIVKRKNNSERPSRLNHLLSKASPPTNQENSCSLTISTHAASSTSGTSTPISTIHKNTYALGRSVKHNITPVRTTPVRTSAISANGQGLDHNNILSLLYQIREQNDQILNHLNKKPQEVGSIPNDLPVEWPVKTIEELNELEAYLTSRENLSGLVSYLSSLGGKDCTSKTNIILRHLITDELATSFNFRGKRQKRPFCGLSLSDCIIREQ